MNAEARRRTGNRLRGGIVPAACVEAMTRWALGAVLGLFLLPAAARSELTTLPSAAGEALTRGRAAAKQQSWDVAIRYFDQAREAAPWSSEALFSLALAYDSAGDREAPAIYWYRAFLCAAPSHQKASQVRDRIVELEVALETKARDLLKRGVEFLPIADKYCQGEELGTLENAYFKYSGLGLSGDHRLSISRVIHRELGAACAVWKDMIGLRRVVEWLQPELEADPDSDVSSHLYYLAQLLIEREQPSGAWELIGVRLRERQREWHLQDLIGGHLAAGDFDQAMKVADWLPRWGVDEKEDWDRTRDRALAWIAEACLNKGDKAAAWKALHLIELDGCPQCELLAGFCLDAEQPEAAQRIRDQYLEKHSDRWKQISEGLIREYLKGHKLDEAIRIFREIPVEEREVDEGQDLIAAAAEAHQPERAAAVFREMPAELQGSWLAVLAARSQVTPDSSAGEQSREMLTFLTSNLSPECLPGALHRWWDEEDRTPDRDAMIVIAEALGTNRYYSETIRCAEILAAAGNNAEASRWLKQARQEVSSHEADWGKVTALLELSDVDANIGPEGDAIGDIEAAQSIINMNWPANIQCNSWLDVAERYGRHGMTNEMDSAFLAGLKAASPVGESTRESQVVRAMCRMAGFTEGSRRERLLQDALAVARSAGSIDDIYVIAEAQIERGLLDSARATLDFGWKRLAATEDRARLDRLARLQDEAGDGGAAAETRRRLDEIRRRNLVPKIWSANPPDVFTKPAITDYSIFCEELKRVTPIDAAFRFAQGARDLRAAADETEKRQALWDVEF